MPEPVKAQLLSLDTSSHIEFMFNPNQLDFSRSIELEQSAGARTQEGVNKTSFKHPNPYSLSISNILIDRSKDDFPGGVLVDIEMFRKSVEFGVGIQGVRRPPLYLFTWGGQNYLKCFVKTLKYKFTLFRPDGIPIRAYVDLSLEEIDLSNQSGPGGTPNPDEASRAENARQ